MLHEVPVDSKDFQLIAKEIQNISYAMDIANAEFRNYSSNTGSIRQMSNEIAFLNDQWEKMSKGDKFTASGKLTKDAKQLYADYKKVTAQLEKQGKTLEQMAQAERKATAEAKKRAEEVNKVLQKVNQTRAYENGVLNTSVKSIRVLSEQQRILTERLSKTRIGTDEFNRLKERITAVSTELQKATGGVTTMTGAMQKQSGVLRSLASMASMYFSVFGALRFAKQIRDVTAELEFQRVSLSRLIQDEAYGAELFEDIKNAAVKSPFRITELVTYTKQLAAYRIEQENLYDTTMRLADISAGLGVDMNRLILAYGQVRSAAVLRGQELRQFTEAGIPLVALLAEKMSELRNESVSTADVFRLISERAVPFSAIAEIFEELTDKGGMFYEMQEKQAETLKGRWAKLKDQFDIALQSIGETQGLLSFTTYNDALLASLTALAKGIRIIPKVLEGATFAWFIYRAATVKSRIATRQMAIASFSATEKIRIQQMALRTGVKHVDAYTAAIIRQRVATNGLARAFWGLRAAFAANPLGLALGVIAGIATALVSFRKKSENIGSPFKDIEDSIKRMDEANKKYATADKLITKYERLSKITERTAKENTKYTNTLDKLNEILPDAAVRIREENLALEDQVAILREANENMVKLQRTKEEETLTSYEAKIEALQEKVDAQQKEVDDAYKIFAKWRDNVESFNAEELRRDFAGTPSAASPETTLAQWKKIMGEANDTYLSAKGKLDELKDELDAYEQRALRLRLKLYPEDATKGWEEWQRQIIRIQEEIAGKDIFPVMSPQDVEQLGGVYDFYKQLKKIWEESQAEAEALTSAIANLDTKTEGYETSLAELRTSLDAVERTYKTAEAERAFFGFDFKKKEGKSTARQQDPFISQLQERMKFMQDYKKGYDNFKEYLSEQRALEEESGIMEKRGLSLGLTLAEQQRAANDLSDWYSDAMAKAFKQAKKHGAKGSLDSFLSQEIKGTSEQSKTLREFQKLIQSLWDAKTDLDTSEMKKNFEDALSRLSDEIKRSEVARDFYKNIFDLTGDSDLAAEMSVSVYGGIGQDFKERLDAQLREALSSLDGSQLTDELRRAFESRDFDAILANLDKFPKKWQDLLKKMAEDNEKYNADLAKNLLKSLEKSKTFSEKRVEIAMQAMRRMADIEAMEISDSTKETLKKRSAKKEAEAVAALEYEAFKETPMYVELFANLDQASIRMLTNMKTSLEALKGQWKDLHPRELKEMQSRLNEIYTQLASRNPFRALIDSIKEYRALQKDISRSEADQAAVVASSRVQGEKATLEYLTEQYKVAVKAHGEGSAQAEDAKMALEIQKNMVDQVEEEAKAAQETANQFRNVAQNIVEAAKGLSQWTEYVNDAIEGIGEIVSTFSSDDTTEAFNIIASGANKTLSGIAKTAGGVAKIFAGDFSGIVDVVAGLGSAIAGVFGAANEMRIRKANKDIKEQGELIEDLEYQYSRLESAIAKSFGSDYITNYNQQLDNLLAKQEAYMKQAEAERSKGKKADQDKIKEYENSAREVGDRLSEMQTQLSEFFTDTDITSAAKDFANAWIEAYKEFGSTADAMKERFQDMIQNMVEKSLAAKIMQELLQPIFDQIDILAREGGELSVEDISAIAKMANTALPNINDAMGTLMNTLAAAGYNIRQHPGQFSGISRNIANASEESISGLAAGINTQNYYMQYMPIISANVATIVSYLTGGAVDVSGATPITPTNSELTMKYLSALPTMDENLALLLSLVRSMVVPRGASPNSAQNFLVAKVV